MLRFAKAAIFLYLFVLLGSPATRGETAQSDRLNEAKKPGESSQIDSTRYHSASSDCLECHDGHSFGETPHSQVDCASCHILNDELAAPEKLCTSCHVELAPGLPELAVFRVGKYRLGLRDSLLHPRCSDCHEEGMYNVARTALTHPVRSVGEHLSCLECHTASGETKEAVWGKRDYQSRYCYRCHQQQMRDFMPGGGHSPSSGFAYCAECHPPHEPLAANLTLDTLELMGEGITAAYDSYQSNRGCLECHILLDITGTRSRFVYPGGISLHELHLEQAAIACVECHDPHDSGSQAMVRLQLLSGNTLVRIVFGRTAACTVSCHGKHHRAVEYWRGDEW